MAVVPSIALADTATGLRWLQAQVQAGGQLASESRAATWEQSHCEVARTLLELSGPNVAPSALTATLSSIPVGERSTEVLACSHWLQRLQGQVPNTSELQGRRKPGDGFAAFADDAGPSVLDTAWALQALSGQWRHLDAEPTLRWLLQLQQADGSFTVGSSPHSDLLTTASVLRALQAYIQSSATAAAMADKAARYLLAQAHAGGHWHSSIEITALIYEAVYPYSGSVPILASAVQTWLLASQQANGAWSDNDPWTTAVALRAVVLAGTPPVNPGQAALKVRFVDGQTGSPISAVQLTATAPASLNASSNASGQVHVQGLLPGADTFMTSATGYNTLKLSASLQSGQTTDLGIVQMLAGSSTHAVITGTVRDSVSGTPLEGVTISIAGQAQRGTTDASGVYLVNGVVPGDLTLRASQAGYFDASAQGSVLAGQALNFSPYLVKSPHGGPGAAADCHIIGTVTQAANGSPMPGATVNLSGANTAHVSTDANGFYSLSGLVSGDTRISVGATGFDSAVANTRVNCGLAGNAAVQFSPKLYATGQAPSDANMVSLSGTVMDAGGNRPIAGAQLTAVSSTGIVRTAVSQADGRFAVGGLDGATAQLTTAAAGYQSLTATYVLQPGQTMDLGQIRLRAPTVTQLAVDLLVQSVKRQAAQTDPQTLRVTGALQVQVRNAGTQASPAKVPVLAFQDRDGNGQYDPGTDTVLGQATLPAALGAGQSETVLIDIAGFLSFRDAPIHVVVDPLGSVAESDKDNNVRSSAQDVLFVPAAAKFAPKLKWTWDGSHSAYPDFNQVMMAPVVGRILDTNGDGRIDEADSPVIVFSSFTISQGYEGEATLRVVDGATGLDIHSIRDPSISAMGGIALADIDGDGVPEIITLTRSYEVVAFRNTGQKIWQSPVVINGTNGGYTPWGAVSVADFDMDGKPEIIAGQSVLNNDGTIRWKTNDGYIGGARFNGMHGVPVVAKLDDAPGSTNSVIFGGAAYSPSGDLKWQTGVDGFVAVARFENESAPSIVMTRSGYLSRVNAQGKILWTVAIPGGGLGGPPTVGDMDGDGLPDIGVAGAYAYSVFRGDGTLMWSEAAQDWSSHVTGSTVFDFDGDGSSEVLYADETKFRAFDGKTGAVIFEIPNTSGTALEYPVVVDIDADGHADIVVVSNNYTRLPNATQYSNGVRVYEDINNNWVPTRSVWNQHAYSITNINDDLSVPRAPMPNWKGHNTFRLNRRMDADPRAIADITASYVRVADTGTQPGSRITVRVGNAGSYKVPAGTPIAVYNTDPTAGQPSAAAVVARGVTRGVLKTGAYEDVDLLPLLPLSQLSSHNTVWIVADDDGAGQHSTPDFDRTNNIVAADLSAISASLQIGVATDKPVYGPTDTASFTATVRNLGSFQRDALVRLTVLDAAGHTVDILPLAAPVIVAPANSAVVAATWSASAVLAAGYQIQAELITVRGVVYGSAKAPFVVKAGTGAAGTGNSLNSARVITDRTEYSAAHTVFIDAGVANLSINLLQENLLATTDVIAPNGQVVWTRSETIAQAVARSLRKYTYAIKAGTLPPGNYQVRIQLFGDASYKSSRYQTKAAPAIVATPKPGAPPVLLSSGSTSFLMRGLGQAGPGVTGQLVASPAAVMVGGSTALQLTVTNNSNAPLAGATVRARVLDPTTGTPVAVFTQSGVQLPVAGSGLYSWNWVAAGAPGSTVPVAATVEIAGVEYPIAQATITLLGAGGLQQPQAVPRAVPLTWQWLLALALLMAATGSCLARQRLSLPTTAHPWLIDTQPDKQKNKQQDTGLPQ